MRSRLVLILLVAAEAAALALAWTRIPAPVPLDARHPLDWLRHTDPQTATLVVGRLLATAVAAWLLLGTVLTTLAGAALALPALPRRLRVVLALVGRAAPGVVRHVVEAALAVGVVAAAATPALAAGPRPVVAPLAPVRDGRAPAPPPVTAPAAAALVPAPGPPAPVAAPSDDHHVVVAGEHLWGIAEAVVRARGGGDDDAGVDRYWRTLCEANRERIASGDVNEIRPGEDLDLPPVA